MRVVTEKGQGTKSRALEQPNCAGRPERDQELRFRAACAVFCVPLSGLSVQVSLSGVRGLFTKEVLTVMGQGSACCALQPADCAGRPERGQGPLH